MNSENLKKIAALIAVMPDIVEDSSMFAPLIELGCEFSHYELVVQTTQNSQVIIYLYDSDWNYRKIDNAVTTLSYFANRTKKE